MKRKVWLCLLAALAVLTSPCLPVAAAPVNGTGGIDESPVVVTGLVQALTISVTHPASAEWTIDVNQDTPFAAPSLVVTNHTRCPVEVSVAGLSRNPDCSLPFVDVLPDHFEGWDALDRAESAGYLALGIRVVSDVDTDWLPGFPTPSTGRLPWATPGSELCRPTGQGFCACSPAMDWRLIPDTRPDTI